MHGAIQFVDSYHLRTRNNIIIEDVTDVVGGQSVEMDLDRLIKTQFSFASSRAFSSYDTYISPSVELTYVDGTVRSEQMGLFVFEDPSVMFTPRTKLYSYTAFDLTWRIAADSVGDSYSVSSGVNYITRVKSILTSLGYTRVNIPSSTKVTPEAFSWPIGTTYLDIINDLLEGAAYYSLFASRDGVLTSFPFVNIDSVEPAHVYNDQDDDVFVVEPYEESSGSTPYNHVIVHNEQADGIPIKAERSNNNASSPSSIQRIGRRSKIHADIHIADQASANDIADRILRESSSIQRNAVLRTSPEPWHNHHEVYQVELADQDGVQIVHKRFFCSGWSLGLSPGSRSMTHTLRAVVPFGGPT